MFPSKTIWFSRQIYLIFCYEFDCYTSPNYKLITPRTCSNCSFFSDLNETKRSFLEVICAEAPESSINVDNRLDLEFWKVLTSVSCFWEKTWVGQLFGNSIQHFDRGWLASTSWVLHFNFLYSFEKVTLNIALLKSWVCFQASSDHWCSRIGDQGLNLERFHALNVWSFVWNWKAWSGFF